MIIYLLCLFIDLSAQLLVTDETEWTIIIDLPAQLLVTDETEWT